MAKFRSIKNSFLAGEISPTAFGRTDIPQYSHACKTLKNMIPMLSGGAYRRPGTFFERLVSSHEHLQARMIPFVVSENDAYALIFSNNNTDHNITTFLRATSNNSASSDDGTVIHLVAGGPQYNHPYQYATEGNGLSYDEINDVQFAQSGEIIWLVHPLYPPQVLVEQDGDFGAFSLRRLVTISDPMARLFGVDFLNKIPFRARNTGGITLTPSHNNGVGRTLTASDTLFDPKHVGAWFFLHDSAVVVTAYTSPTVVTVTIPEVLSATTATDHWSEHAWSDYRGWPRTVGFFEGRIVYGGTASQPDTLWFSESGNFGKMTTAALLGGPSPPADFPETGPTGSAPFTLTISSRQLDEIQWLSASRTLLLGTNGGEWFIEREVSTSGFGCNNASARLQSAYGSSYMPAVRAGNEVFVSSQSGDELKSLVFNEIETSYVAEQLQLLYDEFPQVEPPGNPGGIDNRRYKTFAWDESRKTLWCVDTRGNLFGMTRDRRLGITAWHSHQLGGYDETKGPGDPGLSDFSSCTDPITYCVSGSVSSLIVLPNPSIGVSDVWLVVKRTIGDTNRYFIERMIGRGYQLDSAFHGLTNAAGNYFVDSATSAVVNNNNFTNLGYLSGLTPEGTASQNLDSLDETTGLFSVRGSAVDGGGATVIQSPHPDFSNADYRVAMGLPFNSIVEPVRIEAGSQIGTSQGANKRIHELFLRFYRTLSAKAGKDMDNLETLVFRLGSTPMGSSPELFTGDKRLKIDSDYDRDGLIMLVQDKPLPFTIISIVAEGMTYD